MEFMFDILYRKNFFFQKEGKELLYWLLLYYALSIGVEVLNRRALSPFNLRTKKGHFKHIIMIKERFIKMNNFMHTRLRLGILLASNGIRIPSYQRSLIPHYTLVISK